MIIAGHQASVQRALGRRDVWTRSFRALGLREIPTAGTDPRGGLETGDELTFRAEAGARPRTASLRVRAVPDLPELEVTLGAISARVSLLATDTAGGCLATFDAVMSMPSPLLALGRRRFVQLGEMVLAIATLAAHDPQVVVAGAVISGGRVLAARRARPAELAGKWEMPGGKVEPGEAERDALRRELREELGIDVRVGERIGPSYDIGNGLELRSYLAELVAGAPAPMEADPAHDEIRWVGAEEIKTLDWLPSDAEFVAEVHHRLTAG
jgi:8-oxo-dGTP diphosphatase